jgi:carbamoyltransferase
MKDYNVASLSCSGHEAGVTMLHNGEVYEIILEERLSGKKHDNFLYHIFDHIKKFHDQYGLDEIVLINGEDGEFQDMIDMLEKYKLNHIKRVQEVQEHHLYHASSAFYASGFDEAVCIVIDGWGADYRVDTLMQLAGIELTDAELKQAKQWDDVMFLESTSIYSAQYPHGFTPLWKNFIVPSPQPRGFIQVNFPNDFFEMMTANDRIDVNSCYDIGIMYGTVTYHLGWHRDECGKTMGLAAYGNKNDDFPPFILDNGMANMNVFYSNRLFNTTNFPVLRHHNDFQKKADLAWEVQQCMEDVLRMRIEQALELKPDTNNIVFSGGCALNICANSVVQEEYPNINFYVDPIAGDACQSFGAAKIFHHERTQSTDIKPLKSIYQGIHQPPNSILKKQIELEVARQNNLSYN